jgi:hypothetical protein
MLKSNKKKVGYKWQSKKRVPILNLSGKWLEELGFFEGNTFEIFTMENTILIKKK